MTSGVGVLRDGRVGVTAVSVFLETGTQSTSRLPHIFHITLSTLHTVDHHLMTPHWLSFNDLSLGLTNKDLRVFKGLWTLEIR